MKRAIAFALALFATGMGIGLIQVSLREKTEKAAYLPAASDGFLFAAVGFPSEPETQRSVQAHTLSESYPSGTGEITLAITNNGPAALSYTGYYDFRAADGDAWIPLSPRADVLFDSAEQVLEPGQTAMQTVPIDLFERPLGPGTYRVAQLACFSGPGGACTEITATFSII